MGTGCNQHRAVEDFLKWVVQVNLLQADGDSIEGDSREGDII